MNFYTITIPLATFLLQIRTNSKTIYDLFPLYYKKGLLDSSALKNKTLSLKERNRQLTITHTNMTTKPFSFKKSELKSSEDLFFFIKFYVQKYMVQNILFIHGSAVAKNGKAYIFIGSSGAGKSTISHNAHATLIADDFCVLIYRHNSSFIQPSYLDMSLLKKDASLLKNRAMYRVKGIFKIIKSNNNKQVLVSPAESIKYLLENSIYHEGIREENKLTLEKGCSVTPSASKMKLHNNEVIKNIVHIATSIPLYKLYFRKDYIFANP